MGAEFIKKVDLKREKVKLQDNQKRNEGKTVEKKVKEKEQMMENIRKEVGKLCIGDGKVKIQEILKNNDVIQHGLMMIKGDKGISPLIYLEPYLNMLENGDSTIEETAKAIYCVYLNHCAKSPSVESELLHRESVKNKIIYQVVNLKKNQESLKNVPYRVIGEDLAAVFVVLVEKDDTGIMTVKINQDFLTYWELSEEELWTLASKNTPRLLPVEMENLSDLLIALFKTSMEKNGVTLNQEAWNKLQEAHKEQINEMKGIESQMYVLTNKYKLWGAAAFLYPGVLKATAKRFGKDLIILPSSVHEVILIPQDNMPEFGDLAEIVKNINDYDVLPEEVLSDSVYRYCWKDDTFCRAAGNNEE